MNRYSFVDIETTGSNSQGHKIIEIAIICVDGDNIVDQWSTLINPEREISWGISKLTGIDSQMVAQSPKFYEVARKIIELTEGRIFVAHNVFFDYRFLQREFLDLGYSFQRDVLCTVRLTRKFYPGLDSYSLGNLAKYFNLLPFRHHRAMEDAKTCYLLFQLIHSAETYQHTKNDLKILPPNLDEDSYLKLPRTPGTYFFYDREGLLLYIGKAKSLKDRVSQHFQKIGNQKRDLQLRQEIHRIEFLEWGSEIVASIMELHYIKKLKPLLNRAGRKRFFKYGLSFHHKADVFDEIRISTSQINSFGAWGSKKSALLMKDRIYQEILGNNQNTFFVKNELAKLKEKIGSIEYQRLFKEKLEALEQKIEDGLIPLPGRKQNEKCFIVIENGSIKEIQFLDQLNELEVFLVDEYPDMRNILLSYLLKKDGHSKSDHL